MSRKGSTDRKKVAILFPSGVPYLDRILRGVTRFARDKGDWQLILSSEMSSLTLDAIEHWDGHGAFAHVTPTNREQARKLRIPIVNLSSYLADGGVPRVRVQEQQIGAAAGRHLLDCGFRRFAYYGLDDAWYSQQRGAGFAETVKAAGWPCSAHMAPAAVVGRQRDDLQWHHLEHWLRSLEPPVALMACSDQWAAAAMTVCRHIGLRVPDDVAVIGVNNDEITCQTCKPTLSSVARPDEQIGYEAADLLDRIMAGERPTATEVVLPPIGIVQRESTDVRGAENDHVKQAVRFIRENLQQGVTVQDVAQHVNASRRLLEYRFREHLGETPYQYICELQIDCAKAMLVSGRKQKLRDIGAACGFSDPQRFRLVFKRLTGMLPRDYRARANTSASMKTPDA